jgi:hypothetical protein
VKTSTRLVSNEILDSLGIMQSIKLKELKDPQEINS